MKMHRIGLSLLVPALLAGLVALAGCPPGQLEDAGMIVEDTPPEVGPSGEAATINQIGSTTVLPIAKAWQRAYNQQHPEVQINVSGGGSGAGIEALINGTANIATASREIKDEEREQAAATGVDPVEHVVANDGIAVVVHPDNAVEALSVEQLSDIFTGNVTSWADVGADGMGEIVVVGRDSASGTYESFKEMVVQLGKTDRERDYAAAVMRQSSNEGVRASVASGRGAIGYVGLGYLDDSVKAIAVIPMGGGDAVEPSAESVQDGSYPISRALYMYTDGEPSGAIAAYLEWGLGDEGQALVEQIGFVPVK